MAPHLDPNTPVVKAPFLLVKADELQQLMPKLTNNQARQFAPLLDAAMFEHGITSKAQRCAFLANLAHESAQLTKWVENLNYSAERLLVVFPNHFKSHELALLYAGKPKLIASRVYANRMENGSEESGDGWTYRGRGPIGLTGKKNYWRFGDLLGLDLVGNPDLAALPEHGFRIAALFWKLGGCNELAGKLSGTWPISMTEKNLLTVICKRINGGLNGLSERIRFYRTATQVLRFDAPALVAPPTAAPAPSPAPTAMSPTASSPEPDVDLLDAAVISPKTKTLWPRLVKHFTGGLVWLEAMYQAHAFGTLVVMLLVAGAIAWVLWHNRKWLKSQSRRAKMLIAKVLK